MDYQAQLDVKQSRVVNTLKSVLQRLLPKKSSVFIDRLIEKKVHTILPSPKTFAYRNRAQLKSDGHQLGFLSASSRSLVDIENCLVLTEKNQEHIGKLRSLLPNPHWELSNSAKKKRHWTRIDIDEGLSLDELKPDNQSGLMINQRLPFQQANTDQNDVLRTWLKEKCEGLKEPGVAIELFCGSGNFTEVLSECGFSNILAIEASEQSIEILQKKQLKNVKAIVADLYQDEIYAQLNTMYPEWRQASLLVLDPPREGLKYKEGLFRKNTACQDVFYISCDLATFSRDLEYFYANRFKLVELRPIDQFPHTPHIELMCHLSRSI